MPERVQLSRAKGWRMPPNTMKVDRSTPYGNPITVAGYHAASYKCETIEQVAQCVVDGFRAWMMGENHWSHGIPMPKPPDISALRGKNLACWCKPHLACHSDVLLDLANAPRPHPEEIEHG